MKRLFLVTVLLALTFGLKVRADEGMWLPMFVERLNYVDMQHAGLRLTAEEIYSINHSSLKDAIVQFGRGCTGEIISDRGLLLTNHHCGYGQIQSHSTVEHDYLTDGFWAMSLNEELPCEGLTVRFLVRMEDVTGKVLAELKQGMSEEERSKRLEEVAAKLEKEAAGGIDYRQAVVRGFFGGNEFYLFLYEIYNDVRLVGAPPSAIGKFGGDTDNWMWPRHTGDFSLFRVYSGPDGKPARYSSNNIPLKPGHHLPVSLKGVNQGDYAMILGYPGSTNRYLTSYGVRLAIEETNPTLVSLREKRLAILREDMKADPAVRIKYASKYAGISNYWKYFIGQTRGLKRLKVYDKKKELEARFTQWVNADSGRKSLYGTALTDISSAYAEMQRYAKNRMYFTEGLLRGAEVMTLASGFEGLYKALSASPYDKAKVDEQAKALRGRLHAFFKDYNVSTDQKLFAAVLEMAARNLPEEAMPEELKTIASKYRGNYGKYAAEAFSRSLFVDREALEKFLGAPKAKVLDKDPLFRCVKSFSSTFQALNERYHAVQPQLNRGNRLLIAGLREMQPERKFYPDANSTMRLTYGKVLDYYPADAVHYDFRTTLAGVMEKEDPASHEFIVPGKLKELYRNRDFGPYGSNGELVTCFTSNNDITGGNSGSPVLNGNGELIGLAFDGNWEAMSGDIAFEPELQRTISVDIRYVLFIIDKYAGAKNLIGELTIRQ